MNLHPKGQTLSPGEALKLAICMAKKGVGLVEPNPPVGCVILDKNYKFLSVGYHTQYGKDHAEVEALKQVPNKNLLRGAHVFVTLEPCHHQGKTPSCAKALSRLPIASLTYGASDPFTKEKGLLLLKQKGIKVAPSPHLTWECHHLIQKFSFSMQNQKTFISLKLGATIDGKIGTLKGESKWITGKRSLKHSHTLRASHTGVLIGVHTFLKDNPKLNIRHPSFKNKSNKVVILDPCGKSLSKLQNSLLFQSHNPKDVIVIYDSNKIKKPPPYPFLLKGFKASAKDGQFDLNTLTKVLYKQNKISSLLVEGGAASISQFLAQKAAQKIFLYIAPKLLGIGLSWTRGLSLHRLSKMITLKNVVTKKLTPDFLIEGDLQY